LLIFNNGSRRIGGAYSSVDELVLPVSPDGSYEHRVGTAFDPDKPVWSYSAPKRSEFYANFISGANRLPNGNTLICSGPNGTIFEVTPDKEIVWKYVNPVRGNGLAGPVPPARLVETMPAATRESLKLTDEQNRQLDAMQPEFESKVSLILTEEQKKLLKEPPKAVSPGTGAAPQAILILPTSVETMLKITPSQKKIIGELQKEADARLARILTVDQAKQLKEIRSVFVNGWGPVGPPSLGNAVFRSYRYGPDFPGLKGRELKAGKTVEELQATQAPGN
jgi:hypothetical protein